MIGQLGIVKMISYDKYDMIDMTHISLVSNKHLRWLEGSVPDLRKYENDRKESRYSLARPALLDVRSTSQILLSDWHLANTTGLVNIY